jgi:Ca2+-binding RTX toxin-like protein
MGTLDINWRTITPEQLLEITRSLSVSAGSGADIFYQGIDRHTTSIALANANFSMIDKSEAAVFLKANAEDIQSVFERFKGITSLSIDKPGNSLWADVSRRLAGEASGDVIVAIGNSEEWLWSKSITLNDELPILIQRLKDGQISSINGLSKADLFSSNGVQLFSNTEVFTKLRSYSKHTLAGALEDAARSGQITNAQLFDTVNKIKITAPGEDIYGLPGIEVRINHRTPNGLTVVLKFTLAEISEFNTVVDQIKLSPGFKAGLIGGAFELALTARAAHELLKSGRQQEAERLLFDQFAGVAGGAAIGAVYGALTLGLMVAAGVPTAGLGATLVLAASVTVGSTVGQTQANQLGTELYDFIRNYSGSDTLLPAAVGAFYVNWLKDEGVYAEVVLKNALSGVVHPSGNASRQNVVDAVVRAVENDPSLLDDINAFSGALQKALPAGMVGVNGRAFPGLLRDILEETNGSCFPAGTTIEMADGSSRPIELVRADDWVMSFDATTLAKVPRQVVRLFRGETTDWVELAFEHKGAQQTLTATPGHPFLRPDGTFAPIIQMIDASGQAEIVLRDGTEVTAVARLIRYSAETSGLYEQACSAALSGNTVLALAPIDAWVTYNFEVNDTHTYIAEGVCVHNRCAESFVSETTLNALIRAGLIDETDTVLRAENGQYFIYTKEGRTVTESALKGHELVKVIEVFSDYALHIGDSIESVLRDTPQYFNDSLPSFITALANGQDFEAAAQIYGANIAANMGIDTLARIFGLERLKDFPKDANGRPIIPPGAFPKFFETEVGAAIKGALVSAAVMRILSGKDISPEVYQQLALNTSVRFVVTQALQTQPWALSSDTVQKFTDWFGFESAAPTLSLEAAAGAAFAVSLLVDLFDGGIEDMDEALKSAAIAAGTSFLVNKILETTFIQTASQGINTALGAATNIALPIIGAIVGAVISKIFSKIFGGRRQLPPLFNIQQNADGTITVYFSEQASGYIYKLREGANDKIIGSSGNDGLLGSSGENEIFGRDGDDLIEGREGDDLLAGGKGGDVIDGGTGDDTAIGGQGNDIIDGGEGNDVIFGGDGNDLLFGDARLDIEGASHSQRGDVSTLGEEGDPADGGSGSDASTAAENATKDADALNNDVILGGAGNDTVFAGKGKDYVDGSFGDDILLGQGDDDVVMGGDHNDFIYGGAGNDALDGEAGSDVIYGGAGDDVINGDKLVVLTDTPVTTAIRKWLDTVVIGSQDLKDKLGVDKVYYPLTSLAAVPFAGSFTLGDVLLSKVAAVESAVIAGLEGKTGDTYTAFMGWLASADPALKAQIEGRTFNYLSSDYKPAVDDPATAEANEAAGNPPQLFFTLGGADDFIDAGEGDDVGYGGLGNDTLKGGDGDDVLYGDGPANEKDPDGKPLFEAPGDGNDQLYGGSGTDQILAGGGNNIVEGGEGDDQIISGGGADSLYGGSGADFILSGGGNDLIYAGDSGVPGADNPAGQINVADMVQAGAGADTIYGEGGVDYISGGTEDDSLYGGAGDDQLSGDDGDDVLFGGDGIDELVGGDGQDMLSGEAGNDILSGGAGNDRIYGGDGNDKVGAGLGDDVIDGGAGDDTVLGEIGNDTLSGGDGNDVLSGGSDDDLLAGDDGDDGLFGGSGNDDIAAGTGNDELEGDSGNDTLRGEAGNDTIYGDDKDGFYSGDDLIDAGLGDDTVHAGAGNDTVEAGSGNDVVNAGSGNDSVTGGEGDDILTGEAGNDTLSGDAGNDQLSGGTGDDILNGGTGSDVIDGGSGDDRITAGSGDDQVTDVSGATTVDLGDGNDRFTSAASDVDGDTVDGGAGNDVLEGGSGNDQFTGADGNDTLKGEAGQDILDAGNGDDALYGGADADTLVSGRGTQILQGGDGNDLYRIDLAGLRGTIIETGGIDRIELSSDWEPKDILLEKDGNDLLLRSRSNPQDFIRIIGQFAGAPKIETVLFASHAFSLDLTNVILGTDGDDNIQGTENNDTVLALGGDDIVIGAGGDDFLDGGPGKDVLFGNNGNDLIHGSSEDDLINGGANDDLINDGTGSDMLIGGDGRDTFAITRNAGDRDIIADFEKGQDRIDLKNFGDRFVTLKQMQYFGADFAMAGSDTVLTFVGNQKVIIEDVNYNDLSDIDFNFNLRVISGTSGTSLNERITGGSHQDTISGGGGFDILTGGAGADTFVIGRYAGAIDQITDFNVSQDIVDLTAFSDYVSVYQFDVVQRGADVTVSFGSDQHLILENVQKIQLTLDSFRFDLFKDQTNVSRYSGTVSHDFASDSVIEAETAISSAVVADAAGGLVNQIRNGAGSASAGSTYAGVPAAGSNPAFTASAGSWIPYTQVVEIPYIDREFYSNPVKYSNIKNPFFGSGTSYPNEITRDQLNPHLNNYIARNDQIYGSWWDESISGGWGDDRIYGGGGYNWLYGGPGNDHLVNWENSGPRPSRLYDSGLYGGDGHDYLIGGQSRDWLEGGGHNDVLVAGDGQDRLYGGWGEDRLHGDGHNDTLYGDDGYDLLYGGWGEDQLYGGGHNDHLHGDDGYDTLLGGWGEDNLYGGGHNDVLHGEDGSDYMEGAWGEDQLYGGGHNDHLHGGDGNDTLWGNWGEDVLTGGNHDDVLHGEDWNDLLNGQSGNDQLYGGGHNDHLHGEDGYDYLVGGWGDDNLYGGGHNDALHGEDGSDYMEGAWGEDQLYGGGHNDHLHGGDGNDTLWGNWGADVLTGGNHDDVLHGEDWNDLLNGQSGNDQLYGGGHNDHLHGEDGYDYLVGGWGDDNLYGGGHNDALHGEDGNDLLAGFWGEDQLYGGGNNDHLHGEDGYDHLVGGWGEDNLYGGGHGDTLVGEDGNDLLSGGDGDDAIYGGNHNDYLSGDFGQDVLHGQSGSDLIEGGSGDDYLEGDEDRDVILETSGLNFIHGGAGADFLAGGDNNDILLGGSGSDLITGGGGSDKIDGGTNGDLIDGGDSHDLLLGGQGNDEIYGGNGDDLIKGGTEHDRLYGGDGKDLIEGEDGDDWIVGGAGNDSLNGGSGIDMLAGGIGADRLFGGDGADVIVGGAGADLLYGGAGANVFKYDALNESTASLIDVIADFDRSKDKFDLSDFYLTFDALNITVANGQTDVSVTGTEFKLRILGDQHNLTAAQFDLTAVGNSAANVMTGNAAANWLDGGAGNDTLTGGAGDDLYVVDAAGDAVTEALNEGTDTVQSAVTYTLGANVENLTLTGSAAINGTGNTGANVLTGNAGANLLAGGDGNDTLSGGAGNDTLDGGAGNDTLIGGAGDDTYVVDVVGDSVTEALNEGTDTVQSAVTYTLGANVENLVLTGSAAINGTGNTGANVLTGNAGANLLAGGDGNDTLSGGAGNDTLDGGNGADALTGGAGDDTYVVDAAGDVITEALNEGTDTVQSAITYTLGLNLENLVLTGSAAINGTGNTGANVLTGNAGANLLAGGDGNDTLSGGAGNDTLDGGLGDDTLQGDAGTDTLEGGAGADRLFGGTGQDSYIFGAGDGIDTINDGGSDGAVDTVQFRSGIGLGNLTVSRADSGRDLVVALSATDRMVLDDRLVNVNGGADRLRFADGRSLSVEALVQAMAAFGTPPAGELSLARADVQQYLTPLLASGA